MSTEPARGTWTLRVSGGPAFWTNARSALKAAAAELPPGGSRESLQRLADAGVTYQGALSRIEGCEPYAFDFGDREYGEWLDKHLTAAERAEYGRRVVRWLHYERWPLQWDPVGWRLLYFSGNWEGFWEWPLERFWAWRMGRLSRLARERGGEPPGPSWKIRTEFGGSHGH